MASYIRAAAAVVAKSHMGQNKEQCPNDWYVPFSVPVEEGIFTTKRS